jgi:hypothetical protein
MKVNGIQNITYRAENSQSTSKVDNKPEFIDRFSNAVRNPRDVNDCVAVPRGIFKAYLFIMGGFAALGISGALPQKMKNTKMALNIVGNVLNFISAIYFAKPFAVKGVSPTVKREDVNN